MCWKMSYMLTLYIIISNQHSDSHTHYQCAIVQTPFQGPRYDPLETSRPTTWLAQLRIKLQFFENRAIPPNRTDIKTLSAKCSVQLKRCAPDLIYYYLSCFMHFLYNRTSILCDYLHLMNLVFLFVDHGFATPYWLQNIAPPLPTPL